MVVRCKECGCLATDDERRCPRCGKRLDSGGAGFLSLIVRGMGGVAPGLLRPGVLVWSFLLFVLSMAAFVLAILCFGMGAVLSSFSIGAAGIVLYWTVICWILSGYLCMPVEGLADFNSLQWMLFALATLVPGSLFLWFVKMAAGSG